MKGKRVYLWEKLILNKKKQLERTLTAGELRIIEFERIFDDLPESDKPFAKDILAQYRYHGRLSGRQWHFVKELTRLPKRKARRGARDRGVYWLYAVSDMRSIKIGYAKDPDRRLSELQVGSPQELEIIWRLKIGQRGDAVKNERMLHRLCKAHHLRGEWFDCEVEPILESFKPKLTKESE